MKALIGSLLLCLASYSASQAVYIGGFNPPTGNSGCNEAKPVDPQNAQLTPPTWHSMRQYDLKLAGYGNWVQSSCSLGTGICYYRTASQCTSGGTAPNCTTGSCNDGVTGSFCTWQYEPNNNQECFDDFNNYVLPHLNLLTWILPWSKDVSSTGIEPSSGCPGVSCGPGTRDFSDFEGNVGAYVNSDPLVNPNFNFTGGKVGFIVSHISTGKNAQYAQCSGSSKFCNINTPLYVFSTQWAANTAGGYPPAWAPNTEYLGGQFVSSSTQTFKNNTTSGDCKSGPSGGPSGSDGTCSWSTPLATTGVPQDAVSCGSFTGYQLTTGVSNIVSGATSTPTLTNLASGFPVLWEPSFQLAAQAFDTAVLTRYASPPTFLSNKILYIRIGTMAGGENFLWCLNDASTPLQLLVQPTTTDQVKLVTLSYMNSILGNAQTNANGLQLMTAPNGGQNTSQDCTWADTMATNAIGHRMSLGTEGLSSDDLASYHIGRICTSTTSSSSPGCSNQFCSTFSGYLGQTLFRETQLAGISDPAGGKPGSLAVLLPFATQRFVNSIELFPQDLFTAYDPNWSLYDDTSGAATCGSTPCGAIYRAAIQNASTGWPAATSVMQGHVFVQGGTLPSTPGANVQ